MPPTPAFLTGFEHGVAVAGAVPTPDARIWQVISTTGGTPTIESTGAIKHGLRVLRVPGGAAGLSYIGRNLPASQNVAVASFYFMFEGGLPSADCRFFAIPTAGSFCFLKFLVADSTIRASTGATDAPAGFVVQADTWYLVDLYCNVSANPWILDWSVNGAQQARLSSAIALNTFSSFRLGGNTDTTTATVVVRYDDFVISVGVSGDYPMGEHEVLPFHPNRDGTHSFTAGDFIHGDGGSNVGVADTDVHTYLDDATIETIDTVDSIQQAVVRTTGYIEIGIEGPPPGPQPRVAWGIQISGSYDSTSAAVDACTLKENDGGTLRDVYTDADVSNTTVTFLSHCLTTAPAGGPYTRAVVEGLKLRWGFSGTVPPIIHGVIVEVAYPIADQLDGFGGGGFAAWGEAPWGATEDAPDTGDVVTPGAVVVAFTVTTPTVVAGAVTLAPDSVAAAFAVPAPTVASVVTVTPDPVAAAFSATTPTVVAGVATLTPSPVAAAFSATTPTLVAGGVTLTPGPVVAAFSTTTPTIVVGVVTLTPSPVAAAFTTTTPTLVAGGVTLTPAAVAAVFSATTPTLVVGAVTVTPGAAVAAFTVTTPVVFFGGTAAPSPVVASFTTTTPSLIAGAVTLLPDPVTASFTTPSPTVIIGGLTLTPSPAVASFTVPTPAVVIGNIVLIPESVVASFTVPTPSILVGGLTLTPSPAVVTFGVFTPLVIIPIPLDAKELRAGGTTQTRSAGGTTIERKAGGPPKRFSAN